MKTAYLAPVADVLKEWTPTPLAIAHHFQAVDEDIFNPDGETTNLRSKTDGARASFLLASVPSDFVTLSAFALGVVYRSQFGADQATDVATIAALLTINGLAKSVVALPFLFSTPYVYRTVTASDWKFGRGDVVQVQFTSTITPGVGGPSVNLQTRITAFAGILNYQPDPWAKTPNPVTAWSKV